MTAASAAEPRALLVWCAGTSWDRVKGSDHHMALALLRYADLLWVDPPVSPLTPARYAGGASRLPWPTLTRLGPRMLRLTPRALPLHTRRSLRPITMALLRRQIAWALRRLGRRPRAVVACSLDDVLGVWGDAVLDVVYGTDDYVAGAALMHLDVRRVEREERRQLRNADVAIVVSPAIAERWKGLGFDGLLVVVPNGVLADAYRDLDTVPPAPDVDLPRPVAGLVGQLSSRIDIGLLESVVAAGCSLLLVGPHEPDWETERFRRLRERERVRWVGPQPFERLPGFLKRIDVGLTPYADSSFNRASFPLKTLEYLAAGKPVLSTPLPAVSWLGTDLVAVADGGSFGATAYRLGSEPVRPELVRRRIAFASEHAWERRADAFAAAIGLARRSSEEDGAR